MSDIVFAIILMILSAVGVVGIIMFVDFFLNGD